MSGLTKLEEWILYTAEKFVECGVLDNDISPWPEVPDSWKTLEAIPDEHLAAWARILINNLAKAGEELGERKHANAARQGFGEIAAILSVLSERLVFANFLIGEKNPIHSKIQYTAGLLGARGAQMTNAARTGSTLELGIKGKHTKPKTVVLSFSLLKHYSVAAIMLYEAAGVTQPAPSVKVASILDRYGYSVKAKTLAKEWFNSVYAEVREDPSFIAYKELILDWVSENAVPAWRQDCAHKISVGQPAPEFLTWILTFQSDLLNSFVPKRLQQAAAKWKADEEAWGKRDP